ncbi:hypothetical protein ACIGW1_26115 [Streptomyces sp. NPDC053780]|uniref:hypothetical protein n=1 Tax=unclassified Streptomyces TaxID=2593676 RepID=UPI0034261E71
MTRRRRRPVRLAAVTLTFAAALTLSACGDGSGSASNENDKVSGAQTSDEPSAPPSESEPAEADRPKIELPADVTYRFEWGKSGDPVEDAVLRDAEQRIRAVDMAIAQQDPLHEAYRYYSEGEAAADSLKYIQEFVDHNARTTGMTRFYRESVNVKNDGTASVAYCGDQSKAFNKSLDRGRPMSPR